MVGICHGIGSEVRTRKFLHCKEPELQLLPVEENGKAKELLSVQAESQLRTSNDEEEP